MPRKQKPLEARKRRAHFKSKRGCRNCKLRRVKCDEVHPQCQNCVQYGVTCNYNQGSDLQVTWQDKSLDTASQTVFSALPPPASIIPSIVIGEGIGSFSLDLNSQARLHRFYHRTLPTIGTPRVTAVYRSEVIRLALAHPFLMRIMLTLATTHDRHLAQTSSIQDSILAQTESRHRAHAANLLNAKLSFPILPQDRDALWASAAMLGISVITSVQASVPECWPLKITPAEPATIYLQWMDFSINKKAIWHATDPLRSDSIFHVLADEYREFMAPPKTCSVDEIPKEFVDLCGFEYWDSGSNPYFKAVSMLTYLRNSGNGPRSSSEILCSNGVLPRDLRFIGLMEPEFKALLVERDLRALLILAYWYAPLSRSVWWMAGRARTECRAICLYLEQNCSDGLIRRLLDAVREKCGLGAGVRDSRFTDAVDSMWLEM